MKRLCLDGLPEFDRQVMTLAHNVATSAKFRDNFQQQHQYEDAVSELFYHIASERDTFIDRDRGYLVVAMQRRLYDFLKERSSAGIAQVPREVFETRKSLEKKDTRQRLLKHFDFDSEYESFNIEGRDQNFLQLGLYSQDTFAALHLHYKHAVEVALDEHPDYQNIVRAAHEKTMRGKSIAMACRLADVERRMNESYGRICAYVRESMGRFGD